MSNDDDRRIRPAKRPAGWVAPGPQPAGFVDRGCYPGDSEDLCYLTGDWRILQRVDGHRWSLDDLVTAWLALRCAPRVERYVDLGCGIGSVLMMVAWARADARGVGVEAQALSVDLARRSLRFNGAADRVSVIEGDFRDDDVIAALGSGAGAADTAEGFDLVSGTPPYFPPGTHTESEAVQKGPCRHEHRGGVEAYVHAAARLLSPDGVGVVCAPVSDFPRVDAALAMAGLVLRHRARVVPREGKPPLIDVLAFAIGTRGPVPPGSAPPPDGTCARAETLVVRDRDGQWTADFLGLRADMGMPPRP